MELCFFSFAKPENFYNVQTAFYLRLRGSSCFFLIATFCIVSDAQCINFLETISMAEPKTEIQLFVWGEAAPINK